MKRDTGRQANAIAVGKPSLFRLHAIAALSALALLAIPHFAHAQGIVGGAEEGVSPR